MIKLKVHTFLVNKNQNYKVPLPCTMTGLSITKHMVLNQKSTKTINKHMEIWKCKQISPQAIEKKQCLLTKNWEF